MTENQKSERNTANFGGGKVLSVSLYPQTTRQFELMKSAVERCKTDYPDCFHHKQHHAKECEKLADSLANGLSLVHQLTEGKNLTPQQKANIKRFRKVVKYLSAHFTDFAQYVEQVQASEIAEQTGGNDE